MGIEVGDNVVYQHLAEIKDDHIDTIRIELMKVKEVEPDGDTFVDNDNITRSKYRVKHAFRDGKNINTDDYDELKIIKEERIRLGGIYDDQSNS